MKSRILAAFAAIVMTLGLSLSIGAAPANAAFGGYCASNSLCFYQWTGYGAQVAGDRWQTSYNNVINYHGGCINLYGATWDNGTPINNNTGSAMTNTAANGGAYVQYAMTFFDWENCNASGPFRVMSYLGDNTMTNFDNLGSYTFKNNNPNNYTLYHRVTSVGIRCVIC